MGARSAQALQNVRAYTLCQLEGLFGPCVPPTLFPKAAASANSRDRLYTCWRTFWCLLWQSFNPKASGREVVRHLQALFELHDGPTVSEEDGAYCRAKARLPLSEFPNIGRSARQVDGRRRVKRLGRDDRLMLWHRGPQPSPWLTLLERASLPTSMTVRTLRGSCYVKDFRVRRVTLVTTLLDPEIYPARGILQAYLRRWRLEMCFDDLKTTLDMEMLRSRSPEMAQKEIYARLIGHNLIRCTMAHAAAQHTVALERISFKGALDALRQFTHAMSQARTRRKRRQLWATPLKTLADDLVPDRPGRREPRGVKRVKNKYPRLSVPRHRFKDRPKRSVRRTTASFRKLSLM